MKFSTVANVLAVSSLALASGGNKDHSNPTTVTKYVTQTTHRYGRFDKTSRKAEPTPGTHRYGRFNKTKQVRTTTVLITEGTDAAKRADVYVRATNETVNATSNSTANHSTTSAANNAKTAGVSLGVAGFLAIGAALVI
ncbi:hypothetical protein G210_3476 [Candida maltosa Xu316]|uniref:Hydrophilin n=1 Tax=Candida maltosa (strain Xu316) TaxID=1245528 RepID=M3JTU1_CANMX|nr:hypothetical protein G210_3476 [Candida maltosa Xu316]